MGSRVCRRRPAVGLGCAVGVPPSVKEFMNRYFILYCKILSNKIK
jgi:hypothetical protein